MGDLENRVDSALDNALAGSSEDEGHSSASTLSNIEERTKERSEALSEDPRYSAEKAESEHRRSAIDSAFAKVEEDDKVDQSWRKSKSAREELKERYGPGAIGKAIQLWEHYDARFQTDPDKAAVADELARAFLAEAPRFGRDGKKSEAAPAAEDRSISACLDRADAELADREARAELQEVVARLGPRFDFVLERILGADTELAKDPMGAAARIAASYGMPVTPEHQAAVEHQQQTAQAAAQRVEGFQRVIDSGLMPGFETPEIQDAMMDVVSDPSFQRTGHDGTDLWNAYNTALRVQAAARNEQLKQRSAQRAKLSVGSSGAPVESGRSEAPSTRQALDRAFGSMGM